MAFGGGGTPAPVPEMVVTWTALVALVTVVWMERDDALPRLALAVSSALVLLPWVQLIPLPPALWQALPGREVERAALDLAGRTDGWMPWSVSPARTLAATLALIPPAVAIILAAGVSAETRRRALLAIAAMGLLSVAIGAGQLAGGENSALRFYGAAHGSWLTGFQANRNAAADILLIAILAAGAWSATAVAGRLAAAAAGLAVLAVAVLLTGSRAGMALLLVTAAGIAAWRAPDVLVRKPVRATVSRVTVAVITAALLGCVVATLAPMQRSLARFGDMGDARPELWGDTLYAIGQYWPWGSGLGTFVPVFIAAERLEVVDASIPNRAHNDYLELALEAGLPGLAALTLLVAILVWRFVIRWRSAKTAAERAELIFAGGALAVIAAHSVVDYPLRSMALASLAGLAAGILLVPDRSGARLREDGRAEADTG